MSRFAGSECALGLISYSLYLYHPFANRLPSALKIMLVEIAFSIALATASYLIVLAPGEGVA
jgi:peptidoglycan/LPS O-acetylase OafA/YrhL